MKITAKKIINICSVILGAAGLIILASSWKTYGPFVLAANSVKQLNNHFYYMEFKGDTQLDIFLKKGGAENNKQLAGYIEYLLRGKNINKVYKDQVPLNTGCASISCKTPEGEKVFGRNYDWENDQFKYGMIIKSSPKHGYKSISTVQLDFLGFGEDYKPESFGSRYLASAALIVPLDGMNEKGLCISDLMAGDQESTNQDDGKDDVTTTLAIRSILDFCADVPEALDFLENHDMHSVIGYAHHFAISDISGRSVVVEYVNNEMKVVESSTVTNHYLSEKRDAFNLENSTYRQNVLNERLEGNGVLSEKEVKQALCDIRAGQFKKNSKSWWSAVFNQTNLTVSYSLEENYEDGSAFTFKL